MCRFANEAAEFAFAGDVRAKEAARSRANTIHKFFFYRGSDLAPLGSDSGARPDDGRAALGLLPRQGNPSASHTNNTLQMAASLRVSVPCKAMMGSSTYVLRRSTAGSQTAWANLVIIAAVLPQSKGPLAILGSPSRSRNRFRGG